MCVVKCVVYALFEFRLADFSGNSISHVHNWVSGISLNPVWELIDCIYVLALRCAFFYPKYSQILLGILNSNHRNAYSRWHLPAVMAACVLVVMLLQLTTLNLHRKILAFIWAYTLQIANAKFFSKLI